MASGKRILVEGANAALLDIDFGKNEFDFKGTAIFFFTALSLILSEFFARYLSLCYII